MCYGMYYDYKLVLLFQDTDPYANTLLTLPKALVRRKTAE